MTAYINLPLLFIKFWFLEAPYEIIRYFGHINNNFLEFTSLLKMFKTFFKPLKNEYREGLVGFSIGMGIVVKTVLIFVELLMLGLLLVTELVLLLTFVCLPLISILVFFF